MLREIPGHGMGVNGEEGKIRSFGHVSSNIAVGYVGAGDECVKSCMSFAVGPLLAVRGGLERPSAASCKLKQHPHDDIALKKPQCPQTRSARPSQEPEEEIYNHRSALCHNRLPLDVGITEDSFVYLLLRLC